MTNWTKHQVEALIASIAERPFLYDTKSASYKHRGLRQAAMEEIAVRICDVRPSTTAEDCKRKWHSLRTNYLAEKRKALKFKRSGADPDMVYVPSLYYYKAMAFIDDHIQMRDHTPTSDIPEEDEEESSFAVPRDWDAEAVVKEEESSPPPVFVESPLPPAPALPPRGAESPRRPLPPPPPLCGDDDVEGAFGKYVACRLRNVRSDRERAALMFRIETLFFEHSQK